ncbi:MAG TPA: PAC2 family protein [Ktedonobacteraceae bacterium]|jgi:proteasome assembly chaperone (PAC2) family protein
MSPIQYYEQLELRDPVVVAAFGGWSDAADSATTAVKFLIDRWKSQKIAEIEAEDFFVFTETRPTIKFGDGVQRTIVWPSNQFLAQHMEDLERDVILFTGVEPQLKWKTFSNAFLEICNHFSASEVVFLGSLLADVPHSVVVPITGSSSDSTMQERLREIDIHNSRYEGPTGMVGVLHEACQRMHIPSATLWAAAPHYLAATPNVKVTAALLTHVDTFLSFGLDLSKIQSDALRFEEQVTALVARDPEASAYVRKLEEQLAGSGDEDDEDEERSNPDLPISTGPLPSADSLIRNVEEMLRKQRETNGKHDFEDDLDTDFEEDDEEE